MFLSNQLDINKHLTLSLLWEAKPHLALKSFKAQVFNFQLTLNLATFSQYWAPHTLLVSKSCLTPFSLVQCSHLLCNIFSFICLESNYCLQFPWWSQGFLASWRFSYGIFLSGNGRFCDTMVLLRSLWHCILLKFKKLVTQVSFCWAQVAELCSLPWGVFGANSGCWALVWIFVPGIVLQELWKSSRKVVKEKFGFPCSWFSRAVWSK